VKILALLVLAQAAPPPSTDELVKKVDDTPGIKDQDKPFEIAASLGRLYVGKGRLSEAKGYYGQALAKAEPLRAFLLAQRRGSPAKTLPSAESLGCVPSAENTVVALLTKAQAKAKAGDSSAALACARAAWAPVAEVEVQYGNVLFVLHDPATALAAYTHALEAFEANSEARYGRAALLLDTKGDEPVALKQVKADFERFLKEAPSSTRAPQAKRLLERATAALEKGGISKVPVALAAATPPAQVQPPQLSPEVVRAFENAPRTADMEANFAQLIETGEDHLAHGRFDEARKSYLQVMPYQPNNPRLRAGMAWAMIRLNRQPMADNVWRAAIEAPEAVSALGDTLKAKGDAEGAHALWSRLKEAVPSYAPRLEGKL
jgi:tetratricopeptide (TPR) repeat protein